MDERSPVRDARLDDVLDLGEIRLSEWLDVMTKCEGDRLIEFSIAPQDEAALEKFLNERKHSKTEPAH